jgi:hypothetical protein
MKLDPFAPFSQFTKVFETWAKMTDDSIARTAAFYAEMDKLEQKGIERAENAIVEMAKLTKDGLAYTAQVSAEFRKLSLESYQRATDALATDKAEKAAKAA